MTPTYGTCETCGTFGPLQASMLDTSAVCHSCAEYEWCAMDGVTALEVAGLLTP